VHCFTNHPHPRGFVPLPDSAGWLCDSCCRKNNLPKDSFRGLTAAEEVPGSSERVNDSKDINANSNKARSTKKAADIMTTHSHGNAAGALIGNATATAALATAGSSSSGSSSGNISGNTAKGVVTGIKSKIETDLKQHATSQIQNSGVGAGSNQNKRQRGGVPSNNTTAAAISTTSASANSAGRDNVSDNEGEDESEPVEDEDDRCFVCGGTGNLILCDFPGCPRVYHQVRY
jgi:hypothetical protein